MSGQPTKQPLDATKFREAYLANLNLRAKLDDVNLQANKVYARTGQLPVQPSDFRTTEEKLADVERLRIEVRQRLGEIADGMNANKIAQTLSPKELQFYFQQSPEINSIMRTRYKSGVIADIFLPFLQNYMANTYANQGVASGLQQTSGEQLLLSGENINRALATTADYGKLLAIAPELSKEVREITRVLPKPSTYDAIGLIKDADTRQQLYTEANNLISNLASKTDILQLITKFERVRNVRSYDAVSNKYVQDANAYDIALAQAKKILMPTDDAYIQSANIDAQLGARGVDTELLAFKKRNDRGAPEISSQKLMVSYLPEEEIKKITMPQLKKYLNELDAVVRYYTPKFNLYKILGKTKSDVQRSKKSMIEFIGENEIELGDIYDKAGVYSADYAGEPEIIWDTKAAGGAPEPRASGRGLTKSPEKKRRADHLHPAQIAWGSGVAPTQRFIPIGRYVINSHRLKNDVVAIKRPAGSCLKDFPSVRVSNGLGNVIRTIVGNGVPSFDELDSLDDSERAYLYKLAKESNILDRLSIPAPKKAEIDKDLNEFEIMKGEIIAGNDNKDLIKKFKIMILKLSNKNIIPKPQVRELLFDLTSMGY